jgi:molybdopterin-guanine dinucleotide biosynthesis protein A
MGAILSISSYRLAMNPDLSNHYDAIILAGGTSRRMGHDKLADQIGGRSLLDRVIDAVGSATQLVVVGPVRKVSHDVRWSREHPAGAGPAMAIAAGLAELDQAASRPVIVLAGDIPFANDAIAPLLSAVPHTGVAAITDAASRTRFLMSAWSRAALSDRTAHVKPGDSVASLFAGVPLELVKLNTVVLDCNTPADLAAARLRAANDPTQC